MQNLRRAALRFRGRRAAPASLASMFWAGTVSVGGKRSAPWAVASTRVFVAGSRCCGRSLLARVRFKVVTARRPSLILRRAHRAPGWGAAPNREKTSVARESLLIA